MKIEDIHALWREKQGFELDVKNTEPYYVFVHFLSRVKVKNGYAEKGGCIWYRPYSHRYIYSPNGELLHDWMHISGDIKAVTDKYGLKLNRVYYPKNSREITQIMQEIELEQLTHRTHWEEITQIKMEELCAKISRFSTDSPAGGVDKATYERFLGIRMIIQTEFSSIQTVEQFSKNAGLSPSRFYTLYRRIFGVSPKQDLLNVRMAHAKRLLLQNTGSMADVAEALGYNSQYHFIRQFKAYTGTTPARFARTSGEVGTEIVR